MKFRNLIVDLGIIFQRLKPMGKPSRHVHKPPIIGGEFCRAPLQKRTGPNSQINDNVINSSPGAADQLSFCVWRKLEMHSSESSSVYVKGTAALCDPRLQAAFPEFPFAPVAGKRASFVAKRLHCDNIGTLKGSWNEFHLLALLDHPAVRDRDNKLPSPFANIGILRNDLVLEIPGKYKDIVWLDLPNLFRRKDGNVSARQVFPLFVGIAINSKFKEVGSYPSVVEKGISLPWRPVARHQLSGTFHGN